MRNDGLVLLQQIENKHLLTALIQQLNKDASLSGLSFQLKEKASAKEVVSELQSFLYGMISNDFGSYLNFLYRVDISEKKIKSIRETDPELIVQMVTQLVLEREWQKVWFKSKNR
jgi:hypothetical protein